MGQMPYQTRVAESLQIFDQKSDEALERMSFFPNARQKYR